MKQQQLGEALKEEGIKRALNAADGRLGEWSTSAYAILKKFLRNTNSTFMGEDIRNYAESLGLESPPSNRAWGGIINKAKRDNLIKFVRYDKVKNAKAHCANAAVWRKT